MDKDNKRERVGQNYWFWSNHRNFLNSWWMLNYLGNHHESLPFLYFRGILFQTKWAYRTPRLKWLHHVQIFRTPSLLCMYPLIPLASIMLDHSPRDRNDVVSLLIFHIQDFLRVWEIAPIHTTLWSPLIKGKPSDAIKRKDNYQGDLSPTTQYAPFSTHKIFIPCGKNAVPEIRDLILKYYVLWIA